MLSLGLSVSSCSIRSYTQRLIAEALTVMAKYGTDAHAWIPGIGYINGLLAGNYLDSAGTTAATVDGLIGRMNDAAQGLGAELVTNGGFDGATGWTSGTGWTIGSGVASSAGATADGLRDAAAAYTEGKTYLVTFTKTGSSVVTAYVKGGTGVPTSTAAGIKTCYVVAGAGAVRGVEFYSNAACTIDNISVREVIGIHATQATAGNKPILRNASGKFYAEFNGTTNYLSLSAVPFQMADDHAVIFAGSVSDLTSLRYLLSNGAAGAGAARCASLFSTITTGALTAIWRDDAAVTTTLSSSSTSVNTNFVFGARKVGNSVDAVKNGETPVTGSVATLGVTSVVDSKIGAYANLTNYHAGKGACIMEIKGTLSDADWLTLRRFAGLVNSVSF